MLRILKNTESRHPRSLQEALNIPQQKAVFDPEINLVQNYSHKEYDKEFLDRINRSNCIYPMSSPDALIHNTQWVDDEDRYRLTDIHGNRLYNKNNWPRVLDDPKIFLLDRETNNFVNLAKFYGRPLRTRLSEPDYERWVAYWAIRDIITESGSLNHGDDQAPDRSKFIKVYNTLNWPAEHLNNFSKADAEVEVRRTLYSRFGLVSAVRKPFEAWLDEGANFLHRVSFNQGLIIVERLGSFDTLIRHAARIDKNHPYLDYLRSNNIR